MTITELQNIIKKGECETVEFKSSFNNELIETLVAFANTKGGKVIIGLNQKSKITGVNINPESIQNWVNEIKQKTAPVLIPDVSLAEIQDKTLVIFAIQEYPIKPVANRGKYFKRVVNSNHLLDISEVVNLHLQSFNSSWDFHINKQLQINAISFDKVQRAIDLINQAEIKINDDPLTFLIKNDLLRNGELTNAAYLLFTERETVLTTIELGRFQTNTLIKDSTRSKSDTLSQIEQVMDFVKKHINKEVVITGQARNIQKWQYPLEAVREIICNMIIHRDYHASSDSIVKIFDERIEFYNPGRLPANITVIDLLTNNYKSTPRNKLIADFCKSIGLIEKYGSGIPRIVEYFKEAKLPKPEFQNISEGFMVTIFTNEHKEKVVEKVAGKVVEKVVENRSDNQQKIIDCIKINPYSSAKEIAGKIEISHRKTQENIKKLKNAGILKRIGPAKGGHWIITK